MLTQETRETWFDSEPLTAAPAGVLERVEYVTFEPSFAAGAMMRHPEALTLTADALFGSTDGMAARAPTQVGAGRVFDICRSASERRTFKWATTADSSSAAAAVCVWERSTWPPAPRIAAPIGSDNILMLSLISIGQ